MNLLTVLLITVRLSFQYDAPAGKSVGDYGCTVSNCVAVDLVVSKVIGTVTVKPLPGSRVELLATLLCQAPTASWTSSNPRLSLWSGELFAGTIPLQIDLPNVSLEACWIEYKTLNTGLKPGGWEVQLTFYGE